MSLFFVVTLKDCLERRSGESWNVTSSVNRYAWIYLLFFHHVRKSQMDSQCKNEEDSIHFGNGTWRVAWLMILNINEMKMKNIEQIFNLKFRIHWSKNIKFTATAASREKDYICFQFIENMTAANRWSLNWLPNQSHQVEVEQKIEARQWPSRESSFHFRPWPLPFLSNSIQLLSQPSCCCCCSFSSFYFSFSSST